MVGVALLESRRSTTAWFRLLIEALQTDFNLSHAVRQIRQMSQDKMTILTSFMAMINLSMREHFVFAPG